jgi:PhzF family phenazine biosynthesis protein
MRQWTVDAFADQAFRGNAACVTEPGEAWRETAWMQALAAENNQAETAFLLKTADPSRFGLRWFTPAVEVPLCGHATLASGQVLFTELGAPGDVLTFDTQSGPLTVRRAGERYEMDFPSHPPKPTTLDGLTAALGAQPSEVWVAPYIVALFDDAATVRGLSPDMAALSTIGAEAGWGVGNVAVAALAEPGADHDVVTRFFAPGSGIPEDPATGSLYCILAPMFAGRLGRDTVRFHQAYPGRGAEVEAVDAGARVLIRGRAVTVIESRLRL